ncbi:Immunoglobulin-like fold [Sesbania bispinosa]|nr:Immunoglobulin-like fold [Sesbania bispinosa]
MTTHLLFLLLPSLLFHFLVATVTANGQWQLLQKSIGIVAMHMQLMHNDRVVIYDRTDFGLSNLTLPDGRCRHDPNERIAKIDCTAHSVEYDVASNTFRALFVQTDVWCSSGSAVADGTLIQTGGFNDGERTVRTFNPCPNCDWQEINNSLVVKRWYSTNHILPDGRQIIIGGRRQFNYEFYPKTSTADKAYALPFLIQTYDKNAENNLYPFVFLNVDGNLFIFANNRAILFNYKNNSVVRTYPTIPGGDPRCYPSTGSAVLLPLRNLQAQNVEAEVLICGGAPRGAFEVIRKGVLFKALNTCARIKITDPNPNWIVETMPKGRVMNDMVMLPNGDVLIINGAGLGTAGWENAMDPVLEPFVYKTNGPVGSRFELQNSSTKIPRMYHSTAVLLRDGRVLVGGSNPHERYLFSKVMFPTELSLEAFSPNYLDPKFSPLRPIILEPASQTHLTYAQKFNMRIQVNGQFVSDSVLVTMLAPPFNTHSFSMNQRLLVLSTGKPNGTGNSTYEFEVTTPGSSTLAPPAFYLLFAVHQEIPSEGIWIKIQ